MTWKCIEMANSVFIVDNKNFVSFWYKIREMF